MQASCCVGPPHPNFDGLFTCAHATLIIACFVMKSVMFQYLDNAAHFASLQFLGLIPPIIHQVPNNGLKHLIQCKDICEHLIPCREAQYKHRTCFPNSQPFPSFPFQEIASNKSHMSIIKARIYEFKLFL
jgi:hypothetical protein